MSDPKHLRELSHTLRSIGICVLFASTSALIFELIAERFDITKSLRTGPYAMGEYHFILVAASSLLGIIASVMLLIATSRKSHILAYIYLGYHCLLVLYLVGSIIMWIYKASNDSEIEDFDFTEAFAFNVIQKNGSYFLFSSILLAGILLGKLNTIFEFVAECKLARHGHLGVKFRRRRIVPSLSRDVRESRSQRKDNDTESVHSGSRRSSVRQSTVLTAPPLPPPPPQQPQMNYQYQQMNSPWGMMQPPVIPQAPPAAAPVRASQSRGRDRGRGRDRERDRDRDRDKDKENGGASKKRSDDSRSQKKKPSTS